MNNIMKIVIGIIFLTMLLIPLKVSAFDQTYNEHPGCTYTDMSKLKQTAALVKFSYDYDFTNFMTVTVSNLQPNFYVADSFGGEFRYDTTREIAGIASVNKYYDDQTVEFTFYASAASVCAGEEILTKTVRLPRYNVYYGHKACEGINPDDFSLCSKWYPTAMSEVSFVTKVIAYKTALEENTKKPEPVVSDPTILDLIVDNYVYILLGILGVVSILITILVIRDRKRRVI